MGSKCDSCVFRAGKGEPNHCDYAALTGRTRKAEPPERCTHRIEGKRLETREEANRLLDSQAKTPKKKEPAKATKEIKRIDWELGRKLYDEKQSDAEIAEALGCTSSAVTGWRKRRGLPPNHTKGWPSKSEKGSKTNV